MILKITDENGAVHYINKYTIKRIFRNGGSTVIITDDRNMITVPDHDESWLRKLLNTIGWVSL